MAKVANNITELIGRTPLLELTKIEKEQRTKAQIVAKLEFLNPGRSVKDRVGLKLIDEAERKGLIGKHTVIIEPKRQHRHWSGRGGCHARLSAHSHNARLNESRTPCPAQGSGCRTGADARLRGYAWLNPQGKRTGGADWRSVHSATI